VRMTLRVWPCAPIVGLTAVSVGAGLLTVKVAGALPPPGPGLVTVAVRAPSVAAVLMVMLAVSAVALVTVVEFTVTPTAPLSTVALPVVHSVSVRMTFRVWRRVPLVGLTVVSVGAGLLTVKFLVALPPPGLGFFTVAAR